MTASDGPSGAEGVDQPLLGAADMSDLLRGVGVTDTEIAQAREHRHLELLAIEHLVMPEPGVFDLAEVCASTGLAPALLIRLWRSLGFAEPSEGDRIFTEPDVDMLRTIGRLIDLGVIDDDLTTQMARVIGSSLSRVASVLIDSVDPNEPDEDLDQGRVEGDEFAGVAATLLPTIVQVMNYVWRRHVQAEARARMARDHAGGDPAEWVVGFADLVGFTALSQQITAHELADVVDRFESIAYDTIGSLGGRVVKMIGDEVMFSVPDPRSATEIALSLAETYRDDDELSDVRVGLASGSVLQREADIFGPVVNRASRIVNIAFPGTVVCSAEVRDALGDDPDFGWKSIGQRHLKDIGRLQLYVVRRSSEPEPPRSSRQVNEARRAERREAGVDEIDRRRRDRPRRSRRRPGPGEPPPTGQTGASERLDGEQSDYTDKD